jgi:hypothetical protein
LLHSRLRYFYPKWRRPGVSEDVAALIEAMTPDETTLTLVNTNQVEGRSVVLQAGRYAEHEFTGARVADNEVSLRGRSFTVRLAPGAGARIALRMRRHAHVPTLSFPWD